jgi:hypothetical protein
VFEEWTTVGVGSHLSGRDRIPKYVWIDFLRKNLLAFSDQQLVTGIGLQVSGYIKWCSISLYHFRVIACLALLSTVTHFLTLALLREYFWRKFVLRNIRLVCMVVNFILMVHTIVMVLGFNHEKLGWTSFAFCFYGEGEKKASLNAGATIGAVFGALAIFCSLGAAFYTVAWRRMAISAAIMSIWVLIPIYIITVLVIAPLGLSSTEALGKPLVNTDPPDGEKAWGFGQTLPLLLLALPLMAALEIFYGKSQIDSYSKC